MLATPSNPALSLQSPSADPADAPLLVAVPDAARLLGIGTTFAWELVRAGDIPSVKLGRRVLVPRAALQCLAGSYLQQGRQSLDGSVKQSRPPDIREHRASELALQESEERKGARTAEDNLTRASAIP